MKWYNEFFKFNHHLGYVFPLSLENKMYVYDNDDLIVFRNRIC